LQKDKRKINLEYLAKFHLKQHPILGELQKGNDYLEANKMSQIVEDRLVFENKRFVYCYNCKIEMGFNGHGYECPICGSVYVERVST